MRILCVGYREWALNIYNKVSNDPRHIFLILKDRSQFDEEIISDFKPDLILFYGWSWIVPSSIIEKYKCLMLHPSPLPKYRGGSPIQNQIIAGETLSAVTIFIMNAELDSGDILFQSSLDLDGSLDSIFERIEKIGIIGTRLIFNNQITAIPQNNDLATYCKRRLPAESEITLNEIQSKSATYLFNKIRMLQNPYPNAYIKTSDGKKLVIHSAEIRDLN